MFSSQDCRGPFLTLSSLSYTSILFPESEIQPFEKTIVKLWLLIYLSLGIPTLAEPWRSQVWCNESSLASDLPPPWLHELRRLQALGRPIRVAELPPAPRKRKMETTTRLGFLGTSFGGFSMKAFWGANPKLSSDAFRRFVRMFMDFPCFS